MNAIRLLPRTVALLAVLLLLWTAAPVLAGQHLVAPGDDWERLASKVRPGDEIILMPGRHRPATFEDLHGTAGHPITIRGIDKGNPGLIVAQRDGITLRRPRHVVLSDLVITEAHSAGIRIDDSDGSSSTSETDGPWQADLSIRRVKVMRAGPAERTDAITISGMRGVVIVDCRVEGWGGAAIDLVASQQVHIEDCTFLGRRDHTQVCGVRARGGSRLVWIAGCRFEDAGRAVVAGGSTAARSFRPTIPDDAEHGSRFEAEHVSVERCVFLGGECAVAFAGSSNCIVRGNTIVRPRSSIFQILQENDDPRFALCRGGVIGSNLIVWEPKRLDRLVVVDSLVDLPSFTFEQNLWWPGEEIEKLGGIPGSSAFPQVVDVDPALDADHRPTNPAAASFGAIAE